MFFKIIIKKQLAILLCAVILFLSLAVPIAISLINTADADSIQKDGIKVPIIMYHSVLKDRKASNDFVVTPAQIENDLKYITNNGYTTIFVSDLINFTYNGKKLPERPIILSFDDGYYNNYYYVFPLLEKYKCKAVISPIVVESERYSSVDKISPTYGYCGFKELKEMSDSGYVEIQNHTYDMHELKPRKGVGIIKGENKEKYKQAISQDLLLAQNLLKEKAGCQPICMVYPYGEYCEETEFVTKELGFKASFSCTEKMNYISKEKECLYGLGRYLRKNSYTTNSFFKRIGE